MSSSLNMVISLYMLEHVEVINNWVTVKLILDKFFHGIVSCRLVNSVHTHSHFDHVQEDSLEQAEKKNISLR